MKTSSVVASIAAGVVIVGGGIWAATTLPVSDEGTVTAVEESQTPEASSEPTEPVETPNEKPEESVEPAPEETAAPEYTEAEAELIQVTRYGDLSNLDLSDGEILEAAQDVCAERDAGLSGEQLTTTVAGATDAQNIQFRINAVGSVCVAQD